MPDVDLNRLVEEIRAVKVRLAEQKAVGMVQQDAIMSTERELGILADSLVRAVHDLVGMVTR